MEYTVDLGASSTRLLLGNGVRQEFLDSITSLTTRFVVISDENVRDAIQGKFLSHASWLTVPAGEASKSTERLAQLWSSMLSLGLDRNSAVVAVGGGVVGDLAGFAASTFMRGLPFYSVPTSLLSMVDASVGGKVGIDLPEGKNLVGQFYPAQIVAVDPELLNTLPESEWSAGMAEVIKHGILKGPELWNKLLDFTPSDRSEPDKLTDLLHRAVLVKVDVVREDPYERTGVRATLNLGHTYGHALEWCSGLRLNHGQAVGLGLLCGLRLSRELGLLEVDFEEELVWLLKRWNLPTDLSTFEGAWTWDEMRAALSRDKKNKDGDWCFVLPKALGRVETVVGPPEELVKSAYSSLGVIGVGS